MLPPSPAVSKPRYPLNVGSFYDTKPSDAKGRALEYAEYPFILHYDSKLEYRLGFQP